MLRKLGASLAQAQAAMATVPDAEDSPTHPGRAPRLAAIGQCPRGRSPGRPNPGGGRACPPGRAGL